YNMAEYREYYLHNQVKVMAFIIEEFLLGAQIAAQFDLVLERLGTSVLRRAEDMRLESENVGNYFAGSRPEEMGNGEKFFKSFKKDLCARRESSAICPLRASPCIRTPPL